jgi:hypothetical protein
MEFEMQEELVWAGVNETAAAQSPTLMKSARRL